MDTPGGRDVFRNEPGEVASVGLGGRLGAPWAENSIVLPGTCSGGKSMGSGWAHPPGPFDPRSDGSKASETQPPAPWVDVVQVTYTPLVTEGLIHSSE